MKQTSRHRPLFHAILIFIPIVFPAAVASGGELRLEPDPEIVRYASLEEPMDPDALIRTALVASGVSSDRIEAWTETAMDLVAASPAGSGDDAADAEELLQWMHETVLTRYVETQTRLDVLLDNGRYNCVSSAVLYLILARGRGIEVHGVLTSDHAFCRVLPGGGRDTDSGIDVETTTPFGFDPGRRIEAVDSFTGRTGFAYVPPGNYRLRRDIGGKELISLIYQNRLAALQRRGKWTETVGLARDRWELAGSEAARGDFRTAIGNYAAEMDRLQRPLEALAVVAEAAGILGEDHGLEQTALALTGNAVTRALRSGDVAAAREALADGAAAELVPEAFLEERRRDVETKVLEDRVKAGPFQEAVKAVDDAAAAGIIDANRWGQMVMHLWSNEARRISSGGKWLDGWNLLRNAPERARQLPQWGSLEDSYAHNVVVTYHNRFADAMSRGRTDDARAILAEGLSLYPESAVLRQDLDVLERP